MEVTKVMKWVRLMVAGLSLVGTCAVSGIAAAPPASAATCWWRDGEWLDSGVSQAQIDLYECSDGHWEFRGALWDTACDNRTAYLDIYPWSGGWFGIHAPGCGKKTPFTIKGWNILGYTVGLRTRACNVSCSGEDTGTLYK
jgi:hypothetical protein